MNPASTRRRRITGCCEGLRKELELLNHNLKFMLQGMSLVHVGPEVHVNPLIAGGGNSRCENRLRDDASVRVEDRPERHSSRVQVHQIRELPWGALKRTVFAGTT